MTTENEAFEQNRPKWKHRSGDRYFAFSERWVGSGPWEVVRQIEGGSHNTREKAQSAGFRLVECDDFAIGVVRNGMLVETLWMDEIRGDEPEDIAEISNSLGLP